MARIAFVGNIASMSYLIGRELISRGHEVDVITSHDNIFQTNLLPRKSLSKKYGIPFERTIRRTITKYDVELRSSPNRLVSAKHSIPIFHGTELRSGKMVPEYPCFFTTRDLKKYFEENDHAVWLPRCADTILFSKRPRASANDKIIVGHFPSDPEIKGTKIVESAINLLNDKGIKATLLTERATHEELPEKIAKCHIICDWFNPDYGLYGIISIESLLMDRPVVCHIKEENYDYPEMKDQMINCSPSAQDIAEKILSGQNKQVDSNHISLLYSPKRTADVLIHSLTNWGVLN